MDGLILIIGLIVWLVSASNKKNKKRQPKPSAFQKQNLKSDERSRPIAQQPSMPAFAEYPMAAAGGKSSVVIPGEEGFFRGSLQAETAEGECLCEPELEHSRVTETEKESVYAEAIGENSFVDISPRGIMQAVVMNEILTRPQQRMKRY